MYSFHIMEDDDEHFALKIKIVQCTEKKRSVVMRTHIFEFVNRVTIIMQMNNTFHPCVTSLNFNICHSELES